MVALLPQQEQTTASCWNHGGGPKSADSGEDVLISLSRQEVALSPHNFLLDAGCKPEDARYHDISNNIRALLLLLSGVEEDISPYLRGLQWNVAGLTQVK